MDLLGILLGISLSKAIGTAQAGMGVAYLGLSMVHAMYVYLCKSMCLCVSFVHVRAGGGRRGGRDVCMCMLMCVCAGMGVAYLGLSMVRAKCGALRRMERERLCCAALDSIDK